MTESKSVMKRKNIQQGRPMMEGIEASSRSLPVPEITAMQGKKVRYLLEKGGEIVRPQIQVVMRDASVATVDSHGRVYWD